MNTKKIYDNGIKGKRGKTMDKGTIEIIWKIVMLGNVWKI